MSLAAIILFTIRGIRDRRKSYFGSVKQFDINLPNRVPIAKSAVLKTLSRIEETETCTNKVQRKQQAMRKLYKPGCIVKKPLTYP